jgi:hypothetical protein
MAVPFDRNDVKDTPTATEDSAERGFATESKRSPDPKTYERLGQSDCFDPDEVGDVGDEGRGHRG